ncbi:hypothetical protein EDB19DRAFT_7853 [Suillus lakei]|nr:hypothetical protein EDB19DRAFT_7853 [Suillus lakei]
MWRGGNIGRTGHEHRITTWRLSLPRRVHESSRLVSIVNTRTQIPAAMPSNDHPRTMMNNELQLRYGSTGAEHLRWEVYSQGPPNNLTWSATIYIDDQNYGRASAPTRGAAQDTAAQQAYNHLRQERSTRSDL